jgi:hypothetical protein
MTTRKMGAVAVSLALSLLLAPAAHAGNKDRIKLAPKGQLSPEGWAGVTAFYSCASHPGTTYMEMAVTQTYGPNGEYYSSGFDGFSAPLTCDGKIHKVLVYVQSDNGNPETYRFVPGRASGEASFWNDVLGGWNSGGFGPRVSGTVVLRG